MCYWWKEKPKKELSDEEMISLFKELRKQGIIHVTLVGGEPTVRSALIKASSKIFPYTWVVTNGSFSSTNAPSLPNTFYIVSLDGTEEIHDKIRAKGLYKTIWKNFSKRSDCFTNTTLTKINKDEIEELVKEWSKTKILGMTFDFATPLGKNDNLWLSWKEREELIERLHQLKKKYKDFILLSEKMLNLLKEEEVKRWFRKCPIRWTSISYAAHGKVKKPCILGKYADCSRCGCHITPLIEGLLRFDLETWQMMNRILAATRSH